MGRQRCLVVAPFRPFSNHSVCVQQHHRWLTDGFGLVPKLIPDFDPEHAGKTAGNRWTNT